MPITIGNPSAFFGVLVDDTDGTVSVCGLVVDVTIVVVIEDPPPVQAAITMQAHATSGIGDRRRPMFCIGLIARSSTAQVTRFEQVAVRCQVFRIAFEDQVAMTQNIGAIRHLQSQLDVLFN